MSNQGSQIDIHFYVYLFDPPESENFSCRLIENADPTHFVELSIMLGNPAYSSMAGAFGVSVDGIPWNGELEAFGEGSLMAPSFQMQAIGTMTKWLDAITRLLRGDMQYEVLGHDDETPISFFRTRWNELHILWGEFENAKHHVSLQEFAKLIMRESKKLLLFSREVWKVIEKKMNAKSVDEEMRQDLQKRLNEIRSWRLSSKIKKLERALNGTVDVPPQKIAWQNVLDLIEDIPPIVRKEVIDIDNTAQQLIHLVWDNIAENEVEFLIAWMNLVGKKPVIWQNHFRKRPWKHYFYSFSFDQGHAELCLKTDVGR